MNELMERERERWIDKPNMVKKSLSFLSYYFNYHRYPQVNDIAVANSFLATMCSNI